MSGRRNGGINDLERSAELSGDPPDELNDHVFKALPTDEKLDRLCALYSGIASNVDDMRTSAANREVELGHKLAQLDWVVRSQKLIMEALKIPIPTEPPPPPPMPRRRRSDA